MTKAEKVAQNEKLTKQARELLTMVAKGEAVTLASVKSVSKSGMSRNISFSLVTSDLKRNIEIYYLNYIISQLLNETLKSDDSVKITGCGMDMIFNTLYRLTKKVFTDSEIESLGGYSKMSAYRMV